MLLFCHTMKVDGGHGCQTSKSDKKARNTLTNCQRFIVLKKPDQMQMLLVEDSSSTVAKIHFSETNYCLDHCNQSPSMCIYYIFLFVVYCMFKSYFYCCLHNVLKKD